MNCKYRFPERLARWTSLSICLTLVFVTLTLSPAGFRSFKASAQTDRSARKVQPEAPVKGAPPFNLPNLDDLKRQPQRQPQALAPITSSVRSKRKPLESRAGRTVGNENPETIGANQRKSQEQTPALARSVSKRPIEVAFASTSRRFAHANKSLNNYDPAIAAPPVLGDDSYIQNFYAWALPTHTITSTEQAYWDDILRTAYPGQSGMLNATREFGKTLFDSADYAARNRSDHDYVYDLYKTYLMRDPDSGGLSAWEGQVPLIGRDSVRHGFEDSVEFANLVATITPNGSASGNASSLVSARVDPFNQTGNQLAARDCEWSLPLISLPGRSGLDLGLGLSYSSMVWTRSGPYLYFDEDNSSVSPGFRLGFATIQGPFFDAQTVTNVYLVITSSGQRVELRQVGTSNVYEAADTSNLQVVDNSTSLLLHTTDGKQISYSRYEFEWRATQVKDRNGNFLSIANNSTTGDIQTITDTLGRVITFNYDTNSNLSTISQTWNGATHNWATFSWGAPLSMNVAAFTGASVVGTYTNESIPVLHQVSLDDGSYYTFDYTGVGQVNTIKRYSYDNLQRSYTAYDYSNPSDDCPRITQTRLWASDWAGYNGVPSEVATQFTAATDKSWAKVTSPDGTIHKEFYAITGWQRGLATDARDYINSSDESSDVWQKRTTTTWTHDGATNANYSTNARVTEANVYDSSNNRRRTTISYTTYSLPSDVYEYDANATSVLRRTHTDYNLNSTYTNLRIIGLRSAQYVCDGNQGATPCSDSSGSSLFGKTTYQYDETAVTSPGTTAQHDDASYGTGLVAGRGNLTNVYRYNVNNLTQFTHSTATYNTAGSMISTTDAASHTASVTYTDSFSDGNNHNTYAYPTMLTDADSFQSSTQYNFDFGSRTRLQGPPPQGQSQGLIQTMTYDSAARVDRVTTTNTGAYTRYVYGPNYVQSYSTVNTVADEAYSIQWYDGMGRAVLVGSNHPGSTGGYRGVWTQFDQMGRILRQSNPTEIDAGWITAGDDSGTGEQPVTFTNAVGVSVSGNSLTKTTTDNWGNSGASSTQTITSGDGYVEFKATETTTARMAGLAHSDPDQGSGIDFALAPYSNWTLYKFEFGTYTAVGTYVAGDVLRVAVEQGVVTYRKNGAVISTSNTAPTYPLLADTALYSNGATLNDVKISGATNPSGGWVFSIPPEYDWKGRPKKVYNQDGSYKTFEYAGCGCAGGEVATLTDEMNRQQKVYSDVLGRQWKTETMSLPDANNNRTLYSTSVSAFNARDQVTTGLQYSGAAAADASSTNANASCPTGTCQKTTMGYDSYARLETRHVPEQQVDPNNSSSTDHTTWAYNDDDTIASITDARGAVTTYGYNNRSLVTSVQHALNGLSTINVAYQYDAAGNRTLMTDGLGSQSYSYDQLSRLTSETRYFSALSSSSTSGNYGISYQYNLANELTSITDPFGAQIGYTRDTVGRTTNVTGSGFANVTSYVSNIQYRAWGAVKSASYGNPSYTANRSSTTQYNSRMQPAQFRLRDNTYNLSLISENYTYWGDERLQSVTDLDDTAGNNPPATLRFLSRSYEYDQAGRVADVYSSNQAPLRQFYGYDEFDNMTSRSGSIYWQPYQSATFTYTNNRHNGWSYYADGQVSSSPATTTDDAYSFSYDAAGRLSRTIDTATNRTGDYRPSFDGDGNLAYEWSQITQNGYTNPAASSYIVRSTVLGEQILTTLDQNGNKSVTNVPAEGLLFATQGIDYQGSPYVGWTQRDPLGITETGKGIYDPLGNYIPFQQHDDPRPPAGSYNSSSMSGIAASVSANPFGSDTGCLMDGMPTNCSRVLRAINNGQGYKVRVYGFSTSPELGQFTASYASITTFPGGSHTYINHDRKPTFAYSTPPEHVIIPGPQFGFELTPQNSESIGPRPLSAEEANILRSLLQNIKGTCKAFVEGVVHKLNLFDPDLIHEYNALVDANRILRDDNLGWGGDALGTLPNGNVRIRLGHPSGDASTLTRLVHELIHPNTQSGPFIGHDQMARAAIDVAGQLGFLAGIKNSSTPVAEVQPSTKLEDKEDNNNSQLFGNIMGLVCK